MPLKPESTGKNKFKKSVNYDVIIVLLHQRDTLKSFTIDLVLKEEMVKHEKSL